MNIVYDKEELRQSEFIRFEEAKSRDRDKLDNLILLVNTGALGLLVALLTIFKNTPIHLLPLFLLSILLLIFSLIRQIDSHTSSHKYHDTMSTKIVYSRLNTPFSIDDALLIDKKTFEINQQIWCALKLGICLLVIFALYNLLLLAKIPPQT